MLRAELAKQVAMIGRNDVVVGYYKNAVDQINNSLRPIEKAMNLIPFSELQGCAEGTALQGNLLEIYYQKKNLALDTGYRIAQNGFVSAYANQQYSNFLKALDKITNVIQFLDDFSLLTVSMGNHVRVYSTNQAGVVTGILGNDITVTLDAPLVGSVIRPSGDIGRIT